jgi:hypothetical protein
LKEKIVYVVACIVLGVFLGAVLGSILDSLLHISLFSKFLHAPFQVEFYIIKIEIQLTPASLIGGVVTGILVIKKG